MAKVPGLRPLRRGLLAALALAASAVAPIAQAAEAYVRYGEVERRAPSEVASILLEAVAAKTVDVAWDEVGWQGGLWNRKPLILIGRARSTGIGGLCYVPVTEVEVVTQSSASKLAPGRPRDALRVSALKTSNRYLIVGRLAEQESPSDETACRAVRSAARLAFISPLNFPELLRSVTALQDLLERARTRTLASPIRCIDNTLEPGSCAGAQQTLATLNVHALRRIEADPDQPDGAFTATVADVEKRLWRISFDARGHDESGEIVIEREIDLVLTGA